MKKIVVLLGLSLCLFSFSVQAQHDDPLPWPWGTECPFPWDQIEGLWQGAYEEDLGETFKFKITAELESGGKILEAWRYDAEGQLIARGRGQWARGQRTIHLALHSVGLPESYVYSAILRVYKYSQTQKSPRHCPRNERVTVLTLHEKSDPIHMILQPYR